MRLDISASLLAEANPWLVRATFLDWRSWPLVFPKIHGVQLVRVAPAQRLTIIDVDHDEGTVRNWLQAANDLRVDLWEDKRRYRAHFVNTFTPVRENTLCGVRGDVAVPAWAAAVAPVVSRYATRLLTLNTLRPLGGAAVDLQQRLDAARTRWRSRRVVDLLCDYRSTTAWMLLEAPPGEDSRVLQRVDRGGSVAWRLELPPADGGDSFESLFPEGDDLIRVFTPTGRNVAVSARAGVLHGPT